MDDKKEIEIVSGDSKDLNISPVYDNIEIQRPKETNKKKNIVIPEEKK